MIQTPSVWVSQLSRLASQGLDVPHVEFAPPVSSNPTASWPHLISLTFNQIKETPSAIFFQPSWQCLPSPCTSSCMRVLLLGFALGRVCGFSSIINHISGFETCTMLQFLSAHGGVKSGHVRTVGGGSGGRVGDGGGCGGRGSASSRSRAAAASRGGRLCGRRPATRMGWHGVLSNEKVQPLSGDFWWLAHDIFGCSRGTSSANALQVMDTCPAMTAPTCPAMHGLETWSKAAVQGFWALAAAQLRMASSSSERWKGA